MTREAIKSSITPLRMAFWGGMLCVFDFKLNDFDIINDTAGMVLIAVAVFRLGAIEISAAYRSAMTFVKVIAVVSVVESVRAQFGFSLPGYLGLVFYLVGIAEVVAIIVFCRAMRLFCEEAGLNESGRSWGVTMILFAAIYLFPLGAFYLAAIGVVITGNSFHFDLGAGGLLLLPVFAVPLIHLFMSTSRMEREADDLAHAGIPAA